MTPSRLMISVVDDDEPVRQALSRLVRWAGFDVKTFASGREFLDSLQLQRPACAILDLHLPVLSGLEVQEELKREKWDLPVIMITGRDEPGLGERARTAGAAAFLRKPLDKQLLLETIATVTGTGRTAESLTSCIEAPSQKTLIDEPPNNGEPK